MCLILQLSVIAYRNRPNPIRIFVLPLCCFVFLDTISWNVDGLDSRSINYSGTRTKGVHADNLVRHASASIISHFALFEVQNCHQGLVESQRQLHHTGSVLSWTSSRYYDCRFLGIPHSSEHPSYPQEMHLVYIPTWELMLILSQSKIALYSTVRRPTCN